MVAEVMLSALCSMVKERERISLFQLAARSQVNYSTAHRILEQMELAGMVRVGNRGRAPAPLEIVPLAFQPELLSE